MLAEVASATTSSAHASGHTTGNAVRSGCRNLRIRASTCEADPATANAPAGVPTDPLAWNRSNALASGSRPCCRAALSSAHISTSSSMVEHTHVSTRLDGSNRRNAWNGAITRS